MLSLITARDGCFCLLPCPAQCSSHWLLRCVCAVVKWPDMKLTLAFVSCRVLACGEICPLLTPCSFRELCVVFTLLLVIFCCCHLYFRNINSSVPVFVPIILNCLPELLIDLTIFEWVLMVLPQQWCGACAWVGHVHLLPRLRMNGFVPLLPLYNFMLWLRQPYLLPLFNHLKQSDNFAYHLMNV
jgi:hypothetical protein